MRPRHEPSETHVHLTPAPDRRRHTDRGPSPWDVRPMSRRHHGRPHHHAHGATDGPRRAAGVSPADATAPTPRPPAPQTAHTPVVPHDNGVAPTPGFVPPVAAGTNGMHPAAAARPALVRPAG